MYERVLGELGCDPADVIALRISESGVEADVIDFEHPAWPVRTVRWGRTRRFPGDARSWTARAMPRRPFPPPRNGARPWCANPRTARIEPQRAG